MTTPFPQLSLPEKLSLFSREVLDVDEGLFWTATETRAILLPDSYIVQKHMICSVSHYHKAIWA